MTNIKQELNDIWISEYFIDGQKYFWLYNYDFFRILDKEEFEELNKKVIHSDKSIFAVADARSGDGEHRAYLYFDTLTNGDIFIQSNNNWAPKEFRKLSNDLTQLLDGQDFSKKFIVKDDNDFWTWLHNSYHEYSFENTVPNGVLPDFDLRTFFKETLKGTYLSDHKVINTNALRKYFADFGLHNLEIENVFDYKPTTENLSDLVNKINEQVGDKIFYFVSFNPSAFWGIGNFKLLAAAQSQKLHNYGLIMDS